MVLDSLVKAVRATGGIGVVGVYVPQHPKAATDGAKQGRIGRPVGFADGGGLPARQSAPTARPAIREPLPPVPAAAWPGTFGRTEQEPEQPQG